MEILRGPSWSNLTFNDSVKTMSPKLLRYPGGNVSNYWNWNEVHPQSFKILFSRYNLYNAKWME